MRGREGSTGGQRGGARGVGAEGAVAALGDEHGGGRDVGGGLRDLERRQGGGEDLCVALGK